MTATAPAQQGDTVADSGQRSKRAPRRWRLRTPRWPGRGPGRRARRVRLLLLGLVVVLGTVAGSMVPALTAPGTDSTSARIAEWARDHGMSPLVTWAEQRTYQPPTVGGAPEANSPLDHPSAPSAAAAGTALPAPIRTAAQPPLPGEGVWQVNATVHGAPAMAQTFLRPDATHTSYTAAATWFDPHLVSAQLHPGAAEPGGTGWAMPDSIPPAQRVGLLAAFNSGFKLADARGGFYEDGRTAQPLVAGAASMVFNTDGTMTIGQWGRDVTMSPRVAAVRQNLVPLVEDAHVVPGIDANINQVWGATIGNDKYVWRSGIGVTASGGIVEVVGPGLSADSLATLLQKAGCTQAMELDINPQWTSFVRYQATADPTNPTPINLLPTMQPPADRYTTTSSRDFITLHTR